MNICFTPTIYNERRVSCLLIFQRERISLGVFFFHQRAGHFFVSSVMFTDEARFIETASTLTF
jgi:hypothetical protein